jgi:hypothetical protein
MFYLIQLLPLFVVLQYSRKFLWKVRLFVITTYRKQTNKFLWSHTMNLNTNLPITEMWQYLIDHHITFSISFLVSFFKFVRPFSLTAIKLLV